MNIAVSRKLVRVVTVHLLIPSFEQGVKPMIHKTFVETGGKPVAQVTFTLPNSIWADTIYLVGDFNGWNSKSHPFRRDHEGRWVLSVELEVGRAYQFRYLRDGVGWMSDMQADACVPNPFGHATFVVVTDPNFKPRYD
jgi:1,4-alpha-glucan branching enzyme